MVIKLLLSAKILTMIVLAACTLCNNFFHIMSSLQVTNIL